MQTQVLTEQQWEILEYVDKSNNEIAEDISHKQSKEDGFRDTNEMYISTLYAMKKSIEQMAKIRWYRTVEESKEMRAILADIESVVGIKKDKWAFFVLNDIRHKWNSLYWK